MTVATPDQRAELMRANYSLNFADSEISFLRQSPEDIRRQESDREIMMQTAQFLGASEQVKQELEELIKGQPIENKLGDDEVVKLNALLEDANLAELGVFANHYGLAFKLESRDGTIPQMDLDLIMSNFAWVFGHVKTKMVSQPVFSGVVYLNNEEKKDAGIALIIRMSEIKVQRQTVVWEDI